MMFVGDNQGDVPANGDEGYPIEATSAETGPPTASYWSDIPISYRDKSCVSWFADGHAQNRKWTDKQFVNPAGNFAIQDPASGDLALTFRNNHGHC
jgi:hypothetical protein